MIDRDLTAAIDAGDLEPVRAMLNRGVDVNGADDEGQTALFYAAMAMCPEESLVAIGRRIDDARWISDEEAERLLADRSSNLQNIFERGAVVQRPFGCTLDYRPVGHGIAEGHAQLDDGRARVNSSESYIARGGEVGIAAGEVGDE